jgi:hypothetical protein
VVADHQGGWHNGALGRGLIEGASPRQRQRAAA